MPYRAKGAGESMRTKRVLRYYCDHCKKAGCSKWHMARHEERCTLNPGRICGVCKMRGKEQETIADLLATLPEPGEYTNEDMLQTATDEGMVKLRRLCAACPACILAAIRQRGLLVSEFDFPGEMRSLWSAVNEPDEYYPPLVEPSSVFA